MGNQCVASGGAPFKAELTLNNDTGLTLREPAKTLCSNSSCEKKHHKGLRMTQGKVPEGHEPAKKVNPHGSTAWMISAREGASIGPQGNLEYDVYEGKNKIGLLRMSFARDANSSTRSKTITLTGKAQKGYMVEASFPPDSIYCNFKITKRKTYITARGQGSAGVLGGGEVDVKIPVPQVSDIFKSFLPW